MHTTRRKFLKGAALVGTGLIIVPRHVLGGPGYIAPSDKINLGFIGVGKQARGLGKRFAKEAEAVIVAGCDVDKVKLERWQEIVTDTYAEVGGDAPKDAPKGYMDYQALLAHEGLDAVVIATPDHWHAPQSIAAMRAGLDVYCEKPMAHTVEEGRAMVKAARKYERVFQTGSMQRSWASFRKACELVRNGYIGEVKEILVSVGDPAVACDLEPQDTPEYLNWDRWLGPAQVRAYHPILSPPNEDDRWAMWRRFAEFGGGILSDWGAHMFDIAQWGIGMDASGPVRYEAPTEAGATRGLKMTYANGIVMKHEDFDRGYAVRFIGTEGSLDVSRKFLDTKPEKIASAEIKAGETRLYKSEGHGKDWLDAIKKRSMPICDVEIGHRSASICNIGNIAYALKRPLEFDPVKEKFIGDGEANKMRGKKYRKPYKMKG
ncbi:MAG: Gfo/Idh/MocA family oxidoreductase [Bacteroidota bacterium]